MSRSYRHNYVFKCAGDKSMKKMFNRRLRRRHNHMWEDMPSGNAYKRYNDSWEIADFIYRYDNYHDYRMQHEDLESEEESRKRWAKWFKGGK